MEWLPIESAPKDGRFLLLYEGATTQCMWRGQWLEGEWIMGVTSNDHTLFACVKIDPTHWMTLPAPPTSDPPAG